MTLEAGTPTSVMPSRRDGTRRSSTTVVYITLEYCLADLFSGNGVCARSHVRGLSKLGVTQHVVVGRPPHAAPPVPEDKPAHVILHEVPLAVWRTTDRAADHEAFAEGAARVLELLVRRGIPTDAVLAVDWTGCAALDKIKPVAVRECLLQTSPLFFLNFRVYSRMTNISDEDRLFYQQEEAKCVQQAVDSSGGVMSLSVSDDEALRAMHNYCERNRDAFQVILPMLRDEFAQISAKDRDIILDSSRSRAYMVCLVRLSEDKGPQRFVDICEAITLADPTVWQRTGVIPLMAGASSQPDFAKALKTRFRQVVPHAIVVDEFLNPSQLSQLLQNAILNIHPARYEAFGMTIVEAASCGVPTVFNCAGIGAAQILSPDEGAAIAVDMDDITTVAKAVTELMENRGILTHMSHIAYHAATSWTEDAHVGKLRAFIDHRISISTSPSSERFDCIPSCDS
jgi:glycosyltransferase involved in cell wall biosynthesis